MKNVELSFFSPTLSTQASFEQVIATSRQELKQVSDNLHRFFKHYEPNSSHYPQFQHNLGTLHVLAKVWDEATRALSQSSTSMCEKVETPSIKTLRG